MRIILLGAPGAGKGTQAEILSAMFNVPQVSTGIILRTAAQNGTEVGLKAEEYYEKGRLVPDEIVIDILKERIAKPDCKNGYILDGIPRTIGQAEALQDNGIGIDYAISIEADDDTVIWRLSGRRSCPSCGAAFHISTNQPKQEGICDLCGARLTIRADDEPQIIAERLRVYHEKTEPLKAYYNAQGKLLSVKTRPTIEETTDAIKAALGV
jgi:adenylate kinase